MSEIIPFTPRPKPEPEPEPALQIVEFVLDEDQNCGLTLAITGQHAAVLRYKLVEVTPANFDLDKLRTHWVTLREISAGG